ncbi:lithostathine-1-like [Trichosurus vulpecula]|uniref:lithostathine-1-like n=1 Tax=Trichosurus vulpecula TaxID=9337 RepID=UPI00186B3005|nr:lithostathine-1-like [Trichosurus vulpecula]
MVSPMMVPSFSGMLLACLLLIGLAHGEAAPAAADAAPSFHWSCPERSKIFGSYCYGLFRMAQTWEAAEVDCQSQTSGHQVSLMNETEASFVASLVAESGGSRTPIWIGLYDPNKNRHWKWTSNVLFTYQAWATSAPSNSNPGYCVTLTPETGFKSWKDLLCTNKNFYICKFKL